MPKTNEREWESDFMDRYGQYLDIESTGLYSVKGLKPSQSLISFIRKVEDAKELDTIARCAEVAKNKKRYIEDGFTGKNSRMDKGFNVACEDIATAITSLNKPI